MTTQATTTSTNGQAAPNGKVEFTGTLELVNQVGMKISVDISSLEDAYAKMRKLGSYGWHSGEIPAGGIVLPYTMADKFDFSIIGAQESVVDGEKVVFHRGLMYTRRTLDAQTEGKKKMPAVIKYSRGAKPTDQPHLCEGAGGDNKGYVTLVLFKGNGRDIPALCKPQATQSANRPAA
jgi:hypothetical protein